MIFPNIWKWQLNKTSVIYSFRSFNKQVDQKESTQNVNMKKHQNNYFRAKFINTEILTLTERITDWRLVIVKI